MRCNVSGYNLKTVHVVPGPSNAMQVRTYADGQTFPCGSYDVLLARGQGSNSAGTSQFTSIRDAREMACVGVTSLWVRVEFTIWRILRLAGSLASEKYFSEPG